jgi:hypothetical protein
MANKVSFIIQLKDKFSNIAGKINKNFDKVDRKAKKAGKQVDTFGRKVKKNTKSAGANVKGLGGTFGSLTKRVGALALAYATLETAMAFFTVGTSFQDAMAELSAITGAKGADLKALGVDARLFSKEFGISADIVAKGFTQIASSKSELLKTPGAVAAVARESLTLAKAAGITLPDAIRASVGALNQFNKGADQAARFVNVIAAGAKVGASQVGETAEALKNAGTVAALFGLTFEETNAILQVFAKNELKGAEAGTGLRSTLSKMEEKMGKFAPSVIGITASLEKLKEAELSNTQIIKTFGNENLRSILILQENIPLLKQWTKELTGTNTANDQASTRMATLTGKWERFKEVVSDMSIELFDKLAPAFSHVLDVVSFAMIGVFEAFKLVGGGIGLLISAVSNLSLSGLGTGLAKLYDTYTTKTGAAFDAIGGPAPVAAPTTPSKAANGTLNGLITVAAEKGTQIKNAALQTAGQGLNIGVNLAGATN